jgi:hypothetical protein
MKTTELTGVALDWAVAKCEGLLAPDGIHLSDEYCDSLHRHQEGGFLSDWAQGGPIIEREGICVDLLLNGQWLAASRKVEDATMYNGPTPLIAAMRCYVASKLGDEVEMPEGLSTGETE